MAAIITKSRVIEDSGFVLLARIIGQAGSPVVQSDILGMVLKMYDVATGDLVVPSGGGGGYTGTTLTVSSCILNTPATNAAIWPFDDGYNFICKLDGSYVPEGGTNYQAEITVTPATGDEYTFLYQLSTINRFGS